MKNIFKQVTDDINNEKIRDIDDSAFFNHFFFVHPIYGWEYEKYVGGLEIKSNENEGLPEENERLFAVLMDNSIFPFLQDNETVVSVLIVTNQIEEDKFATLRDDSARGDICIIHFTKDGMDCLTIDKSIKEEESTNLGPAPYEALQAMVYRINYLGGFDQGVTNLEELWLAAATLEFTHMMNEED